MENNVAHILNNLTPKEKAKIIAVEKAKIEKSEKIAKLEAEFNLLKDEIEKIKGQKSKIEERIQTREAKIKILENPNTQDQTKIIKAEEGVTNSDKLESLILGKIVYHNFKKVRKGNKEITNEIPNDLAYSTSKNAGYDSYASWNPEKKNFYIESENTEGLNKIAEEINKISKESNLDMPLEKKGFGLYGNIGNLTEEEFIKIIEGQTTKPTENNTIINTISEKENINLNSNNNEPEQINVDENKEKGEVFYMMKPVDNYFLDKNKSKINKETVYQFQLIGNGRAEFEINFLGDVSDVVKRNESYIKPACNEDNLPKEENGGKTTKIITLQKGEAELQGDKWIITKKAVIRYE